MCALDQNRTLQEIGELAPNSIIYVAIRILYHNAIIDSLIYTQAGELPKLNLMAHELIRLN